MRPTVFSPVTGLTFASLAASTLSAAAGGLDARQNLVCTEDAIFKGLFSNSLIAYDATTFCESLLTLTPTASCYSTTTPRVYVKTYQAP